MNNKQVEEVKGELELIIRQNTSPYVSPRDGLTIKPEEVVNQILSHPKICVLDDSIDIVPEPSLLVDKLQIFLGKYKDAIKYGHTNTMTSTWALDLERLLIKANFRKVIREQQVGT